MAEERDDTALQLPMSRIKKIIKLDPEHISSTESANYILGISTELFIKQLTLDASTITKSKGRKKIMYNDMQEIVSTVDVYSFMRDLVPKRAPLGELLSKRLIKLRDDDNDRIVQQLETEGFTEEGDGNEGGNDNDHEMMDVDGAVENTDHGDSVYNENGVDPSADNKDHVSTAVNDTMEESQS